MLYDKIVREAVKIYELLEKCQIEICVYLTTRTNNFDLLSSKRACVLRMSSWTKTYNNVTLAMYYITCIMKIMIIHYCKHFGFLKILFLFEIKKQIANR